MDKLTDFDKKQYINFLSGEKNYRNIKKTQGQLSSIINKIPKKFYRYRSLASGYEIDNIINGQIWLSKPTEFNDPYDSKINIDVDEMIQKYLETNKEIVSKYNSLERSDKREANRYIKKEKIKLQKNINSEVERFRKTVGIACFSEEYDSLLMWSHYADYHRGICLEYSFEEIKKLALFCPVVYTNDFENLINYIDLEKDEVRDGAAKLFVNKSKDWSYEREWRIIVPLSEDGEEKGRILDGLKPQKILTGCRIDDENERRIIKAAKKIHIPLEKMKMDTKKFRVYVDK